jgi:hypothetical protein
MPWTESTPFGAFGAPPQLHGGNVEGLASALAQLRYKQIKDAQDAAVSAAQQIQANRAANAYIQTAQSSGLVPQGDYGGGTAGATYATDLGKLMEAKRLRDLQEKLYGGHEGLYSAQENYQNAMADWVRSGGKNVGRYGTQGMVQVTDKDGNTINLPAGSKAAQAYLMSQNPDLFPKSDSTVNSVLKGYGLTRGDIVNSSTQRGYLGGQPLPVGQPWQNADEIEISPQANPSQKVRIPKDIFMQLKSGVIGVRKNDVDQAAQALDQNTPLPAGPSAPPPAQTQPPTNMQLAPGYGQAISDEDQQALAWARANPDDPRAAAILKKLGIR